VSQIEKTQNWILWHCIYVFAMLVFLHVFFDCQTNMPLDVANHVVLLFDHISNSPTPATEAYKLIYAKREVVQIGNLEESLPSRLADPLAPTFQVQS
jgi:hypothetical protein